MTVTTAEAGSAGAWSWGWPWAWRWAPSWPEDRAGSRWTSCERGPSSSAAALGGPRRIRKAPCGGLSMRESPRPGSAARSWTAPRPARRRGSRSWGRMAESKATVLAELRVPASDEFISVAKRVATSLGVQLGFGLDELDELAIAVVQAA